MTADVYSAIPGRGLHKGITKLRRCLQDVEGTRYCFKFDVHSFYPSVNHDILIGLIKRKIKCRDTLWLLEDIIRSPGGDTNIPIGNYLSQYFANVYLNPLDHVIKETLRERYYIRYGDDGVILHGDKRHLQEVHEIVTQYLKDELELQIHLKSQVFPVDVRGIDFLGYRCFRDYTLLRKSSARRFKRAIRNIENNYEDMNPQTVVSSVMSYIGWIKYCDGNNLLNKYIANNNQIHVAMAHASSSLGIKNPLISQGLLYGRSLEHSTELV